MFCEINVKLVNLMKFVLKSVLCELNAMISI